MRNNKLKTYLEELSEKHTDKELTFRFFVKPFVLASIFWIAYSVACKLSLNNPPEGKTYDFTPKGISILLDFSGSVILISLFSLIYSTCGLMVRKWLAYILRALMWMIFVLFMAFFETHYYVAVVKSGQDYIFIKPFHKERNPHIYSIDINTTESTSYISFKPDLDIIPVRLRDKETIVILEQFVSDFDLDKYPNNKRGIYKHDFIYKNSSPNNNYKNSQDRNSK